MTLPTMDLYGANGKPSLTNPVAGCTDLQGTAGATNAAAAVTMPAPGAGNGRNACSAVFWSYSGAPTGGRLYIDDGAGNIIFDQDVGTTTKPWDAVLFDPPLTAKDEATAMVFHLAAGGAGVTGKIRPHAWVHK